MANKKISYLSRTFDDYKEELKKYIAKYYPSISESMDDASIGSWLVEIVAAVADNLSFHLDKVYNETNIDSASQKSSVYSLARNNGFKIPGPKAAVAELTITCEVPSVTVYENGDSSVGVPNEKFMPKIKKGTKFSSGTQYFELTDDVDFSEQFDNYGYSDRTIYELTPASNGSATSYQISKKALVVAGQSKIFKQTITSSNIKPFMEVVLPDKNVLSVESIIFKEGENYNNDPSMNEFMNPNEYVPATDSKTGVDTYRFFEVNSLLEQYRWGDDISNTRVGNQNIGHSVKYTYGYYDPNTNVQVPTYAVTKGEWIPLTQKFMTEYTDNGYLKITFGSGELIGQTTDYSNIGDYNKFQISKMIRNEFLGKLPLAGWTMYVLYRVGGGLASNVAANTITKISYLNAEIGHGSTTTEDQKTIASVKKSLTCTNEYPSVSGKDSPTVDELKMMIKYNNSSQERCVTLKDYEYRTLMMPAKYGCPFRVSAMEENNKVMLYILGVDNQGRLSDKIPTMMVKNIENYLSMYRSMNDFVEIKNGRIINVSIEVDLFLDKTYSAADVLSNVVETITNYMDINKHELGEDIYIGDIEKEIGNVDGVLNVIETRVFNEYGNDYSEIITSQTLVEGSEEDSRAQIDLDNSQYILNSEPDEMFEIKYPNRDIRIKAISR